MDTGSTLVDEMLELEQKLQENLLTEARDLIDSGRNRYDDLLLGEKDRLLSERSIRRICLKYRLRFLDIKYFRGELPDAARNAMQKLEAQYGVELKKLKIIAPGELFRLERREKDPILLAEIAAGKFLFIHKWGNEFTFLRRFQALPLRNIPFMILSIGLIALMLATALLPFTTGLETELKVFGFGFAVIWGGCLSYALFLSFSQNIFPTTLTWNSKFLD